MKNILVTGSSGYIGSVLCQMLVDLDYFVTGIDTLFFTQTLAKQAKFPFRKQDIRNVSQEDLSGFDAVIHLAALSNDPLGDLKKEWTEEINYKQTLRLAKMAKNAGVKRFIFSSSCSVYGISKIQVVNEASPTNPQTAYAKTKIKAEHGLAKLADKNFTVILLRNSTVYGFSPAFRDDLVVNNFVACGLSTGEIKIKSDGSPWRPLIDVRDLSDIFIKFLSVDSKKVNGKLINVGFNDSNYQVKDLLSIVQKKLPKCKIIFTREQEKDSRSYKVNFNKFEKLFPGIKKEWNVEKSVADLILNLNKYGYKRRDFLSGNFTRQAVLKNLLKKKLLTDKLFWKK